MNHRELSNTCVIQVFPKILTISAEDIIQRLHQCAISFVKSLFDKHIKIVPSEVIKIEVTKQDRNINVLCIINDDYAILGELVDPVWQKGGKERTIFFGSSPRAFEMWMHQPWRSTIRNFQQEACR